MDLQFRFSRIFLGDYLKQTQSQCLVLVRPHDFISKSAYESASCSLTNVHQTHFDKFNLQTNSPLVGLFVCFKQDYNKKYCSTKFEEISINHVKQTTAD